MKTNKYLKKLLKRKKFNIYDIHEALTKGGWKSKYLTPTLRFSRKVIGKVEALKFNNTLFTLYSVMDKDPVTIVHTILNIIHSKKKDSE